MQQAERVREIVESRWKDVNFNGNFIVCGDLNDRNDRLSAVRALTKHPHMVCIPLFSAIIALLVYTACHLNLRIPLRLYPQTHTILY